MKRSEVIKRLGEILKDKFKEVCDEHILNEYYLMKDWLQLNGTPLKLITYIKDCGITYYGSLMLQIGLKTYSGFDFGSVEYSILI